ncbi:hypothetical protein RCH23_002117 [Cryobacterium sp. CAN_C3]|uniref:hypothetical protein n=1 Tax=unclassified Cryobacterium TaxID=2649013 RepID=UPI0018CB5F4A|nr:hypothetical protein [Cryobacterium sp. CAN_C3]MEC5154732.1 hypothetical protein [Cryobacterium sp. CAN_C3]
MRTRAPRTTAASAAATITAPPTVEEVADDVTVLTGALKSAGFRTKVSDDGLVLRLALGDHSTWIDPGTAQSCFVLVLRVEAGEQTRSVFNAAAKRSHLTALLGRISAGWSEVCTDGRRQHFVAIDCESGAGTVNDRADAKVAVGALAARGAWLADDSLIASIITRGVDIAPSRFQGEDWAVIAGRSGQPTRITASELAGLGVLLDEASVRRDPSSVSAFNLQDQDSTTAAARDYVNRRIGGARVVQAIRAAGFELAEAAPTGERRLLNSDGDAAAILGGPCLPADMLRVVPGAVAAGFDAGKVYRAFDIIAALEHSGDAERAAEALIATGEARVRRETFAANSIPELLVSENTVALSRTIVHAIADATNASHPNIPMAMQRVIRGKVLGIISVSPSGSILTWNEETVDLLISTTVQLIAMTESKLGPKRAVRHEIPKLIKQQVWRGLNEAGALPEVQFVGTEPVLTDAGVISAHGFHPREKALVALPERERRMWQTRFKVPATPTREQAQASWELINTEVMHDFPYETVGDRARHYAYLLTCVARPYLSQSPFWLVTAYEQGSGKGVITETGRLISTGTGDFVPLLGGKSNEIEDKQAITSAALDGKRFVHSDEAGAYAVGGRFMSSVVTAAVTTLDGSSSPRVLGGNKTTAIAGLVISGTGNNLAPGGDLPRRTMHIRIKVDGGIRAAERTGFRHKDLYGYILQNRPELLAHLHTVLTYGLQHEPAEEIPTYGFTGNWPAVVLGAMSHLTLDGRRVNKLAVDLFSSQIAGDGASEEWGPLMETLFELSAGARFESSDARNWAALQGVDVPFVLRRGIIKGSDVTSHNSAWTRAFKARGNQRFGCGDFDYQLSVNVPTSKSRTMTFSLVRYDRAGQLTGATRPAAQKPAWEYLSGLPKPSGSTTPADAGSRAAGDDA